jgi:glycosyltransferase involved in cell wall biosynthesis
MVKSMIEFSVMKVLFFARLFSPHIGGVEKHVAEISKILIKKGHEITLITEQYSQDLKLQENIDGIKVFRIPNIKEGKMKKFQIWKWLFTNYKLIEDADIVHCHDVFFWYLPFRFIFLFKKVFITFHGYEDYPLKSGSILMHRLSEKLSMGNICIGDFMKKWYKTKPNFVSYGAVTIPSQKLQNSSKLMPESAVFIGRLDKQTGILTYTEAVESIRRKIPDFKFLIIGDGNLKGKIDKKNIALNAVENAPKYFENYNFAFVSRYLSILEALAARKLIFAVYDNPIKEDYLKMAPFAKYIIITNSPLEIEEKVLYFLNNPLKKQLSINAGAKWVKEQSWNNLVNNYLKLWC